MSKKKCCNFCCYFIDGSSNISYFPLLFSYFSFSVVESVGGQCLPCVVDIREEDQVQAAVEAAVKKFGGIDILVNNASAINLTGTLETSMKR